LEGSPDGGLGLFGFMRPILTMRLFSRLFTSVRGDMTRKLCRTTRNSTSDESLSKIVGSIPIELGLVVERLSDRVLVEPQGMSSLHTPYVLCSQRSKVDSTSLVVGDFVKFQRHKTYNENISLMEQDVGVVVNHEPRSNYLKRPAGGGNIRNSKIKGLAANVDIMVVVIAANPIVPPATIDRLLVVAHANDMHCILVLNKVDEEEMTAPLRDSLRHYEPLGYTIIETSTSNNKNCLKGISKLNNALKGKTSIFVGQSGVGKSSLVNALVPDAQARVGSLVRSSKQLGAHTTSTGRLFHLLNDDDDTTDGTVSVPVSESVAIQGSIIDSPGIREMGLWHLPRSAVAAGFLEIAALSKKCKYKNCVHGENAQGCAVRKGVELGLVHQQRLTNYLDFMTSDFGQ